MHGLLDRGSYARLLSRCDAGLVLVKPETMVAVPYKACDFAAAGLAIINSLPGELAGLLDRYRAGIPYEPGNATSLARAIRELATDPRRLTELGRGARRLAESELSRERIYGRFADWLEGLAIRP
jgi:glycosyltransferase involved in cell wall biosynthesis